MSNTINYNFENQIIFDKNCTSLKKDEIESILDKYKEVIVGSLITSFCLDKILFDDVDGGSVQTIGNIKKEIYSSEDSKNKFSERLNREYNRDDYAPASYMNKRRKEDFKKNTRIIDGYTGKELNKDGSAHLEHINSAKEAHSNDDFRILNSKEEMAEVINSQKNTIYTDGNLNKSKNDSAFNDWANRTSSKDKTKTNAEYYNVDMKKGKKLDKRARKVVNSNIAKRKIEHYSSEFTRESLKNGGAMAIRQGLGVIFTEVALTIMEDLPYMIRSLKNDFSIEMFLHNIKDLVISSFERVRSKMDKVLEAIKGGFTSGIVSTIATGIANMFVTTSKNIVRIIRESMVSICNAVKVLFFNDGSKTIGEKIIEASKILITCATGIIGVIVEEGISSLLKTTGLALIPVVGPIVTEVISTFSGILVSGLLSVTFLYYIDNSDKIKKLIDFINRCNEDMFDKALENIQRVNEIIDKYIADLSNIDVKRAENVASSLHSIGDCAISSNVDALYKEVKKCEYVDYKYSTKEEFDEMMLSDDFLEI